MLLQIVTHTPLYVWAILAFLFFRGVIAMRDREMGLNKMFIIPVIMLLLSLQDIAHKFGAGGLAATAFTAWAAGALAMSGLVYRFSRARVSAGESAGRVLVRGSAAPLVLMMSIFVTKYVTAVAMAIQPHLADSAICAAAIGVLFGCFNGYFGGRLLRDVLSLNRAASVGQNMAI